MKKMSRKYPEPINSKIYIAPDGSLEIWHCVSVLDLYEVEYGFDGGPDYLQHVMRAESQHPKLLGRARVSEDIKECEL